MNTIRMVSADELRADVLFEVLIEPVSRAFQESSAGLADNGLIVMFPAARPDLGDVYIKTGTLRGHAIYIIKVSPWFALPQERGQAQGGFIGVFDSQTGHTIALLNDEHYLSDIRTPLLERSLCGYSRPHRSRLPPCLGQVRKRTGNLRRCTMSALSRRC